MKRTAIFLVAAAMLSQVCYADSIDSVEYDRASQKIKVCGSYDDVNMFRPMFVMKVNDGDGALKLMTQYENAEVEGKFSFEIPVTGETGEYTVTVNSNAFAKALSTKFNYYSAAELAGIIAELNDNKITFSEFEEKILAHSAELGIDEELNKKLSAPGTVYLNMYGDRPFADIGAFLNSYYKNAVSLLVYEGGDLKYNVQMMDAHKAELGITDEAAYGDYSAMSSEEKETVAAKLAGMSEKNDFEKSFNEAVVLALVKNSNSYGETGKAIKKYESIVKSDDISSYFSKTDTEAIDLALTGNDYSSIKDLRDAIEQNLGGSSGGGSTGGNSSSTGGTSGGSSGGGSYSGIAAPSGNNGSYSGGAEISTVYTDIENVEWAKNAIYALSESGILNGVGEGLFAPNQNVKREEFVKILVEAFKIDAAAAPNVGFSDVTAGAWYEKYINAGVMTGAINGVGDNRFGVGQTITRQDMAVMAYRFARYAGVELENSADIGNFSDRGAIASYAAEAISALYSEGIVTGMSDSGFAPLSTATRAQAAVMVHRLLQFTEGGHK